MGHSIPGMEEGKSDPPPRSPVVMPEKHGEEGEVQIKYIKNKKKTQPPTTTSSDFGEPEYYFISPIIVNSP